jgi:ribosomal protein L7/L12
MDSEERTRFAHLEARMHQMEQAMQAVLSRLGINPAEVIPQVSQQHQAIQNALMSGDKIKAIKLYGEQYGVGLIEAKAAIDAMEHQMRGY